VRAHCIARSGCATFKCVLVLFAPRIGPCAATRQAAFSASSFAGDPLHDASDQQPARQRVQGHAGTAAVRCLETRVFGLVLQDAHAVGLNGKGASAAKWRRNCPSIRSWIHALSARYSCLRTVSSRMLRLNRLECRLPTCAFAARPVYGMRPRQRPWRGAERVSRVTVDGCTRWRARSGRVCCERCP